MGAVRSVISIYRTFQYALCGRSRFGVMEPGKPCSIEPFKADINHGDVVHPCVRYIPEGFEGHCWWLVYTPYYNADASMENPILCYAESNEPEPPTEWKVYCEVKGKPKKGYNSDPVLLYDGGKLYVFWREYGTEGCEKSGHEVATFGGIVKEGEIVNEFGPIVWSDDAEIDSEVSPTFIRKGNEYICLAMHLKFHSRWLKRQKNAVGRIIKKMLFLSDLLGLGGEQKSYGIARWKGKFLEKPYVYDKTIKFDNCNKLYRPWHMDFFESNQKLYAIVQTNQCNADICLAVSEDYEHFSFLEKPLITNATVKKLGIYKPTAGVVGDKFFLYYTAQDKDNRSLNHLYLTEMPFGKL